MIVKLLTEHLLEFPSLISNCWKSHAAAQFQYMALYHSQMQRHAIMVEQGKNKEAVFFSAIHSYTGCAY